MKFAARRRVPHLPRRIGGTRLSCRNLRRRRACGAGPPPPPAFPGSVSDLLTHSASQIDFGERKISPGRGVRTLAGGKSASALAAPGMLKKISEPRRGDRKHSISVLHRFLSPLRGSILFCRIPGAAPALRAYPRLVFFHPHRGLKIPRAFSPTNSGFMRRCLQSRFCSLCLYLPANLKQTPFPCPARAYGC